MTDVSCHPSFKALQQIIHNAADAIMEIYQKADLGVEQKSDDSPVTAADIAANTVIMAGLEQFTPEIPILSEEAVVSFEERKDWQLLWVVDPLDGTKEFIKRNGEFSINIALVRDGRPILGIVYLPTTAEGYFGVTEAWQGLMPGAFKWQGDEVEPITVREPREPLVAMTSRSHGPALPEDLKETLKDTYEQVRELPKGSSIKGCRIAEGVADLHLRRGPTSEWDTAAQQAIIEAAGGQLIAPSGKPFRYNQRESLLNGHFIVAGPEITPVILDWYKQGEDEA
ncbi:3'(2'),5'-bisphosphate nucleotidase CysQ [Marinomonas ostreistagni]|uniref:3'(2'),5'-bisphosphate nucleotidase CysQ n=1 Tax=Marinomonas ostreistagni TaxID=359209 RepID=UPI00194F3A0E|nr:3'(2'),5'-bisphosphate nucleotidase CysQ [Marinomonas ostreistagni]MBM6550675.1 3'(2'),5'-bisphosphate nucleotidase CysQ [Marinomonas ostreistagni]